MNCVQQWVHPNGIECISQFSYEPLLQQEVLLLEEEEWAAVLPHIAMYATVAVTGHRWLSVLPTKMLIPFPN